MDFLPKDIENIILDYKNQMESYESEINFKIIYNKQKEKYKKHRSTIKKIEKIEMFFRNIINNIKFIKIYLL